MWDESKYEEHDWGGHWLVEKALSIFRHAMMQARSTDPSHCPSPPPLPRASLGDRDWGCSAVSHKGRLCALVEAATRQSLTNYSKLVLIA